MGVRYVPAAALGGVFMAVVPDVLTRYGHGTFMGRVATTSRTTGSRSRSACFSCSS